MSKRPELFLKAIIFSLVGMKPQLVKVETVLKIEKVRKLMPLLSSTCFAWGIVMM